jgi:hypothetical protein
VIKSASKPFAKQIKLQAAKNAQFHNIVVKCAQTWHYAEGRMSLFVGDKSKQPRPLNVNAAIDLGAELASEGFLLAIAVALLVLEYNRSTNKDKQKEEALKMKFLKLETALQEQQTEIAGLKETIQKHANELSKSTVPQNIMQEA